MTTVAMAALEEAAAENKRLKALLCLAEFHLHDAGYALSLAEGQMRGPADDPAHVRVARTHDKMSMFRDYVSMTTDEIELELERNWYRNVLSQVAMIAMDEQYAGLSAHERLGIAADRLAQRAGIDNLTAGITREGE